MEGRFCRLEPIDPDRHAAPLFAANAADLQRTELDLPPAPGLMGRFLTLSSLSRLDEHEYCLGDDPLFFAIVDRADSLPAGVRKLSRDCPGQWIDRGGSSSLLRRAPAWCPAATEAMYLLMKRAFTTRLPTVRMEMRRGKRGIACGGGAPSGSRMREYSDGRAVYKDRNRDTAPGMPPSIPSGRLCR